jgi:hypothetical protein
LTADIVEAAATTDSCANFAAVVVMVLLVKFAVGSAITLPPERMRSPSELALENRRGKAMNKSAGDGRNEVALANAPGEPMVRRLAEEDKYVRYRKKPRSVIRVGTWRL